MPARFHREALRRLEVEYAPDPAAMRALAARASHLGILLPASFVEWYGMRGGIELLKRNSNCDEPLAIEELGDRFEWRWSVTPDCLAEGRLIFMFENQAVSVWALGLRGGDDPPVFVARDPDLEWRPCAEAFSTFVGCQVWDHTEIFDRANPPRRILVQAQDVPLRSNDLAFLRQGFSARATTHGWPGDNQYRFERGEARILIWDGEDQADWWITAATAAGLAAVVAELRHCGTLGTTLWSDAETGTEVLATAKVGLALR
jgi:hypothetical protein